MMRNFAPRCQFRPSTRRSSVPSWGSHRSPRSCMEAYADRPALAQRATELVTDPATGRTTRQLLEAFRNGELSRVVVACARARECLASRCEQGRCAPTTSFASSPLPASTSRRWISPRFTTARSSCRCRPMGRCSNCSPSSMRWSRAGSRPASNPWTPRSSSFSPAIGPPACWCSTITPKSTPSAKSSKPLRPSLPRPARRTCWSRCKQCARAAQTLPAAPLFAEPATDKRHVHHLLHLGQHGLAEGRDVSGAHGQADLARGVADPALLHALHADEPLVRTQRRVHHARCRRHVLLHCEERSVRRCSKTFAWSRPTFMGIVPRICEMVYQQYQVELERRAAGAADIEALQA